MFIYLVEIEVKPENLEEFKAATLENAQKTTQEPNNVRFDVLQRGDDPCKFMLYEVYVDESGLEEHRLTEHYRRWKDAVASWMAAPRKATKYGELFFR